MDPAWISTILGGGGSAAWTIKELVRLNRENKALKAERDTAEDQADTYRQKWIDEQTGHAKTTASIASLEGQIKALTEQVERQAKEIARLREKIGDDDD